MNKYKCNICDYKTENKYNLQRHLMRKNPCKKIKKNNRQITTENRQITTENRQITTENRQITTNNRQNITINEGRKKYQNYYIEKNNFSSGKYVCNL